MKWPESLTLVRHDTSAYNALKSQKKQDPLYRSFQTIYEKNPDSDEARRLAIEITEQYSLNVGDHDTPLAPKAGSQAKTVGEKLKDKIKLPDVIFVSPYLRAHLTLEKMKEGWPELSKVKIVEEERIREQDHGMALIYNDWRVFNVLHPEQRHLRNLQGAYWYRFPQGESVSDVRARARSWQNTLTRDYVRKNVVAVTHHLTILSLRANLERLNAKEFLRLDEEEKPINCGVTIYKGDEEKGTDGKLILEVYNVKLY
jgi:broad specificity phosphatase PhoE